MCLADADLKFQQLCTSGVSDDSAILQLAHFIRDLGAGKKVHLMVEL
jgi:hypothetical protein